MSISHPTGLGEPETEGKLSLFQPPKTAVHHDRGKNPGMDLPKEAVQSMKQQAKNKPIPQKRIRTTIALTSKALVILQQIQQEHRLKTGRVLPIWKALSMVISSYAKRG